MVEEAILGLQTLPHSHAEAAESAAFDEKIRHVVLEARTNGGFSFAFRMTKSTCCMSGTADATHGSLDQTYSSMSIE